MNNMRMLAEEEENDDGTEVTWEDQQRINTFSKLNTRLRSIEERLEELKVCCVLYKIGESFLHLPQPRAMKRLEKDQAVLSAQVLELSAGAEQCEKEMKELKVTLYARFGRAINLDE
ncbi:Prefoldin subunit 4 [Suillus occidentalis]|nr:Prefoldin subunit 4 [Suillus occidentalis]